jgi:hypothetical protein
MAADSGVQTLVHLNSLTKVPRVNGTERSVASTSETEQRRSRLPSVIFVTLNCVSFDKSKRAIVFRFLRIEIVNRSKSVYPSRSLFMNRFFPIQETSFHQVFNLVNFSTLWTIHSQLLLSIKKNLSVSPNLLTRNQSRRQRC